MKKPTILKFILFALIFLQSIVSHSQNFKDFEPRYNNKNLRGDILLIGNSILNRDTRDRWGGGEGPNVAYDKKGQNGNFTMSYVNVDGGPGIFNSSSAKLDLPNPTCSKIVYVGLYWSAVTRGTDPIDKVKFKMPGGSYIDIVGTVIYDAKNNKVGSSLPYASYANVTDYFTKATPLPNPTGSYSVANVSTAEGSNKENGLNTGLSAGWSLFFVYENATLPEKAITSFDGFSAIDKNHNLDINVSGFTTIPVGRVKAKFAFSAIEGDADIQGDFLAINGEKSIPQERPLELGDPGWVWNGQNWVWVSETKDNFFNSSVTSLGTVLNNRKPNSANTLGFDAGVFEENNPPTKEFPGGSIIKNGDTSAVISLGSTQDVYFYYFNAFAVEIIAPRIVLVKKVIGKDNNGNDYDAGNKDIGIDKELRYEIGFQNKGNDDAVNFTITDILPNNIIFDETKDILPLPAGVTVASYNKATRTIVFNISPDLVIAKGGIYTIKFRVKTIKDCESLTDACSNAIKNTAISKYNGIVNPALFVEGSLASDEGCNVGEPTATNFLIGLDKCKFEQTLFLCGTVKLKAGGGYQTYVWKDPNGVVFGGNNQEVTVTKPGTYTVVTTATPPCLGIQQKFIVKDYVVNINDNPINEYADNIDPSSTANPKLPYPCINDGKPFPKIFLCGKTATKFIDTKITGASSIVWQETKDARPPILDASCPDVVAKNWTEIGVGPTYTVNKAGTFRLVVTYNNTCVNMYYFNVTQSVLDPTFIKEDIVCDTKGSITITNPKPNDGYGYEYSLDGVQPYQASNVFDNVPEGRYLVHIRTKAVDNTFAKCIYTADVTISKLTFTTNIETTDPYCNGETGTIKATANGVNGWYKFIVTDKVTGEVKGNSGQVAEPKNYHLFEGIAPGTYNVEITTKDGCKEVKEVIIKDYKLSATATITKHLTCEEGEITVVATGGKPVAGVPPYYYYYVNGAKTPLTDPVIRINKAGDYSIVVTDDGGCSVTIPTITVPSIIRPTVKIDQKNINCYGNKDGEISFTLTPAISGYTVSYSINGLAGPFSTISPIKNLEAGDYDVVVKYTYDQVDCFDESKLITIAAPTSQVTASAGVAELSGCGLPGNEKQGKVRITNAQGGIPPYKYSFDEGNTWQDSNEAYIDPRATPYTFYIKDSSPAPGCPYPMEGIILEEKPADPTIEVSTPTFNCDGTANTKVTVTNAGGANYEYEYLLNGNVNQNNPPNVFVNVPASNLFPGGYHVISVRYKLVSVPTFSSLLKEDFGTGADAKSPGIDPSYCWEKQDNVIDCNVGNPWMPILLNDGEYVVTKGILQQHYDDFGWVIPKDHTTAANAKPNPLGRYLAVNIGGAIGKGGILYSKPIKDIIPGQDIKIQLYALNLMRIGNKPAPNLTIELHKNGVLVPGASVNTADIIQNESWNLLDKLSINPGNNTSLDFVIRSNSIIEDGNDLAIDDIFVYQLPKSCLSTKDFKVVVDPNKKFTAEVKNVIDTKCNGSKDGSLTIIASNFNITNGFDYSIDGKVTWINSKLEETIVEGLGKGPVTVEIRYDKDSVGCNFTIDAVINSPPAFEVDAIATAAKCSVGATVTASAKGGTPEYIFTLIDSATPPNIVVFPTNGILTNILPGTYTVSGKDKNGCLDDKDTPLVIDKPVAPKAEIEVNTGLCFDGKTATITVNITDGVAPYYYQVKYNTGGLGSKIPIPVSATSFTYETKATGDYTFVITDSYGCEATVISQTINPKLTADALTTSSLTCIAPKEAKIEVTINGGTTPFSYKVKDNTGTEVYASVGTIAGPKFTYNTTIAGKYTFEITDKNKCTTTAEGNVAAITDPEVTATPTNPKCNGESNGSVTLLGSLGSGGYKYNFDSSGFTDKTIYTGLKAGVKYSYQVMDSKGCVSAVKDITLTEPDVITPSVSITPYTCEAKAVITASATGGNSTTYTYVLSITKGVTTTVVATNNTGIFKDLTVAGDYSVTITDSKGCSVTKGVGIIADLDPPTAMVVTNDDLKCTTNLVKVTIKSVSGGTGTLEYAITAPAALATPYQLGLEFDKLASGTYTFTVRDANKCTFSVDHEIKALIPIVIKGEVVNNISCLGSTDGSAKFTITDLGNNVRYSYNIDGGTAVTGTTPTTGSTTIVAVATNLGAGNHTLTITDLDTNCPFSKTVEILAPAEKLEITLLTVTAMTCIVDGKVVVTTKGGWGSNKYSLIQPDLTVVGPQSINSFGNLTQKGDYTVTVKDLNGCEVSEKFTLADKVKPDAKIDLLISDLCYDKTNKATIVVTPKVPSLTYEYKLDHGVYQPSGTFPNLEPGDYVVTVRDKVTGCTLVLTSQHIAKELTATVKLDKGVDCTTDPDIVIKGEVFEGTAPYTYTVTVNGVADPIVKSITGNKFSYTDATATTATTDTKYVFVIKDNTGCTTTSTVIVKPKTDPKFTAVANSTILCNGEATGSITVTIDTGFGVGPYVIDVYNTTTSTPYYEQTTGLPAGFYTVKVTDAKSCFSTESNVEIKEPTPITVVYDVQPITCNTVNGESLGSITITSVTGGTKNYTYNVKGLNVNYDQTFTNQTGTLQVFKVVDFGYYEVIVTDANNCSKIIKNILVASPPKDLEITVTPPVADCSTGGSAIVAVGKAADGSTITGNGPFYFAIYDGTTPNFPTPMGAVGWLPEDALPVGSKQATFNNLTPGVKYTFIVYDSNAAHGGTGTGCYYYETSEFAIPTNSKLEIDKLQANNITCLNADNGNVSFKVYSKYLVPTDVEYQIFNELTQAPVGPVQSGVVPGVAIPPVSLDINNFGVLPFGNYYVLVTEIDKSVTPNKKGCSITTLPFNITGSTTALVLDAKPINNANCNPLKGVIDAFPNGGTTFPAVVAVPATPTSPAIPASAAVPYLYQIVVDNLPIGEGIEDTRPTAASFVIGTHSSSTFKVDAGNYLVYVRDAYGCIAVKAVTVVKDPEPIISAVIDPAFCSATEGDFAINVNITTLGVGPYTYTLNGGNDVAITTLPAFTISDLASGKYKIKVKDLNGCTSNEVELEIFKPLDLKAKFTLDPVCEIANGTITAEVLGGNTTLNNFRYTLKNNTVVIPIPADIVQDNNGVFLNQAAGSYTVTVEDLSTLCKKTVNVNLEAPTKVVLAIGDIDVTLPNCMTPAGQPAQGNISNGTIKVNLPTTNNNPEYTYILTPIAPLTGVKTNSHGYFDGLFSGDYDVTVKSERGCEETIRVTIGIPVEVVASAKADAFKCSTGNTPKATTVTVTGAGGKGTGAIADYLYSNNGTNWVTTNTFDVDDNETTQNITYYVQDENGCIDDVTIPIAPFPKLTAPDVTFGADMDCNNKKQEINVTIKGGTSAPNAFTYKVYEDGNDITGLPGFITVPGNGNTFTYDALKVGSSYKFEIFDNNTGCSIMSGAKTIPEFDKIELVANVATKVGCFGESTGQISITISGYTGEYQYQILEGGVAITGFSGTRKTADANPFVLPHLLKAGTDYTVLVKEMEFPYCDVTSDVVIITEPEVLKLGIISNVNQNCNTAGAVLTIDVASITGGTQAYTYGFAVKGTAYADVVFSSTDYTKTIPTMHTTAPFDEWDVYVKDSNGCYDVRTETIKLDLVPFDIKAKVATQCFDLLTNEEYVITVTADGVKPLKYSLTNVEETFTLNNQLIVKSPGTYPVYVQDANGCVTEALAAFTVLDPLGLSAEITTYPTCNGGDGEITLTGLGGSGGLNYEYSKDDITYTDDPLFKGYGYGPGSYTFYVRDKVTLCIKSIPVVVPTAAVVTIVDADLTPTPVTCFDGIDGTITVVLDASNNNPDYKFTLSGADYKGNPVDRPEQKEPTFSNLPAGKYTISVMSGRNCQGLATTEVIQPDLIIIDTPSITEFACNDGENTSKSATIEVNVKGGIPMLGKYKYVFTKKGTPDRIVQSGVDNTYTETNPAGGSYIIEVSDGNSCSMDATAEIKPFINIDDVVITVVDGITCSNDGENIKVTATSTGILPTLEYTLQDANKVVLEKNRTGLFNKLSVGEYMIIVENLDTNCSLQRPHRVYEPNTFKLVASNVNSITCYDAANGKIDFTLVDTKGTPSVLPNGFDYVITSPVLLVPITGTSPNLGPLTIDNLKAGLYTIVATLKDSPFCPVEAKFTISGPLTPLELDVQHSEITCVAGNNDGKIVASATGGWPGGYEYQLELKGAPGVAVGPWSWSTNSTFINLIAGDYVVKVKDSKCEVAKTLELKIPTPIAVTISSDKTMLNCFGDNGATITVNTITGGSGKYLYTLVTTYPDGVVTKNGPQESKVFTGLKAGSYMVVVTDDWKCTGNSTNTIVINEPPIVKASLGIKTDEGCFRLPEVTLTATGGTGPYKYGTDGVNFPISFPLNSSSTTIVLPATTVATTYKYFVQDALGCISYATAIDFSPVPKLDFSSVVDYDIHCKGSSTGSIYAAATGGLGNYVYTLLDANKVEISPLPTQNKPGRFDNLAQGDYFVKVVSDDCSTISLPVSITEPLISITAKAVPTDLTCNGSDNGKITVIAEGGTGVLRYAISPDFRQFFESNVFDDLEPGFYDILIQDENGCEFLIEKVEIKQPDILDLTLVPNSILPEFCDGDKDGAFSIEIVGGTAPYRVTLDDRNGTYEQLTTADHTFSNLVGGTHIVYVLDANDCTAELEIVTPDSVKLLPTAKVNTDCVNNLGANFVTITIDATNTNPSDIDYALDGSTTYQQSNIFENVAPGKHTVTARHTNGCEQKTSPFIIEVLQPLTLTLADGGLNEIVATATGGGGDYKYTLDGESYGSVNKFIIYKSGTYTVTVTDKNGCTATATRYFEYIDVCIPNHFTPNGDGINDTWAPGCTVNYKDLTFDIFDRYGRVICKYKLGQKWDGRYNGAELPSGDYWYVLKLNDNKDDREFVGHFTLYR
ncbi:T9SS type B sorting domain-containing protein [Flavobacterium sp. ALJ2]|uniref:T9SS type B sorting domain-containing protein n=1 Tax=Flavobacterium sp. ALJ2 TaxID=2786960 RepID=UPI00189EFA88|nr:T9SS type B sorting domain-containing protein [Flavobacterium sp. ALJ2]MBF7092848.1 T9SS type B sorting domain-containing protein [Flavobacterium sp. ALJ2]